MRVHTVKKARKDIPSSGIKAGETYYWGKFRYGGKICSKTPPGRSQLTRSEYLAGAYDADDAIQAMTFEDMESVVESAKSDLESLRDQAEEKLENIPEQLRDASAGSTLQEYIDQFETWINTLEGLDFPDEESLRYEAEAEAPEIDEEDLHSQARAEVEGKHEKEQDETDEDYETRISGLVEQAFQALKIEAADEREATINDLLEEKKSYALDALKDEAASPL